MTKGKGGYQALGSYHWWSDPRLPNGGPMLTAKIPSHRGNDVVRKSCKQANSTGSILRPLVVHNVTARCTCSESTAEFLFRLQECAIPRFRPRHINHPYLRRWRRLSGTQPLIYRANRAILRMPHSHCA